MSTTAAKVREKERVKLMPGMNRFPRTYAISATETRNREVVVLEPGKTTIVSRDMADMMAAQAKRYSKSMTVPDGTDIEGRMRNGMGQGKETEEHFDKNPIVFLDRE